MVADAVGFVVGVDTHRDQHAVAVVDARTGVVVFETVVSADTAGYEQALAVAVDHATDGRVFAVEGTGSYGAGLTRFLTGRGERVVGHGGSRWRQPGCQAPTLRLAQPRFEFLCRGDVDEGDLLAVGRERELGDRKSVV